LSEPSGKVTGIESVGGGIGAPPHAGKTAFIGSEQSGRIGAPPVHCNVAAFTGFPQLSDPSGLTTGIESAGGGVMPSFAKVELGVRIAKRATKKRAKTLITDFTCEV
jgi:hypothetical protein